MASKNNLKNMNKLWLQQSRNLAKLVKHQDPEEVKNMPIFQYATKDTKRSKRIYMWGNTVVGALGNANFIKPTISKHILESMNKPWRSPFGDLHKVRDVACGYGFTVFAASNEEEDFALFGTGLNSDCQIGYQCKTNGRPLEIVAQPVPIALPLLNKSTKVVKVDCGRAHTIAVTDKEGAFSLGSNSYGQCGVPVNSAKTKDSLLCIHQINGIEGEISQVVCGQDHTLILTSNGRVYSFGWGADGQTGLGHYNNQFVPALVKGDIESEKIIHLTCKADCVLAVSDKGDVFGWGNSEYRQLNMSTNVQQINFPMHLNLKVGKVVHAASGGTMCAVLNEKGQVYVWGYGILGQGPQVSSSNVPALLPPPLFGYNEFNEDVWVTSLNCGLSHFAAVTNFGHLYMWGRNRHDCLGLHGKSKDQYFPYKVAVPAEVLKVSCGVDHTAALCRSFA